MGLATTPIPPLHIPRGVVAAGTFHRDAGRGVHTALSVADAAQVEPSILLPHPLNAQPLVEVRQVNPCKAQRVVVVTHREGRLVHWTQAQNKARIFWLIHFRWQNDIAPAGKGFSLHGPRNTLEGPSPGNVWSVQIPH